MKAIILAGGKGSRLLPHTLETPKTLINIGGKTIIERIIESLPDEIEDVIIVVKHLQDKIKSTVGENFLGKKIFYVEQGEKTGTYGALLSAKDFFKEDERFLVTNGDDIHNTSEYVESMKYPRSMAVQKKVMPNYYKIVMDKNNYFLGFSAQTDEEKADGTLVATGVYVLDSNIFKHPGVLLGTGEYGLPQTALEQVKEYPIKVIETEGWIPVNTFKDIEEAEKYFNN